MPRVPLVTRTERAIAGVTSGRDEWKVLLR
jgi:hypothetical protein